MKYFKVLILFISILGVSSSTSCPILPLLTFFYDVTHDTFRRPNFILKFLFLWINFIRYPFQIYALTSTTSYGSCTYTCLTKSYITLVSWWIHHKHADDTRHIKVVVFSNWFYYFRGLGARHTWIVQIMDTDQCHNLVDTSVHARSHRNRLYLTLLLASSGHKGSTYGVHIQVLKSFQIRLATTKYLAFRTQTLV